MPTVPHEQQATPQTQAKLKRGTLQYMIERGVVSSTGAEMQAAEEIGRVYTYLTAAVMPGRGSMERIDKGISDEDPAWFVSAYQKRYKEWANNEPATAFYIAIAIIVGRETANDLDKRFGWRKGNSGKVLLWSLRRYALISEWVTGQDASDWRKAMAVDNSKKGH